MIFRAAAYALLFSALAAGGSAAGLDWPQWRGPTRDGTTSAKITRWPPRPLWQFDAGYGVSSVIVAAGRVFAMGHQGDRDTVHCLDGETGQVIWQYSYVSKSDQTSDVRFPGPRSTPATDGKALYTLSLEGRVHCLEAGTGKLIWSKTPQQTGASEKQQYGVCAAVLVHGNLVICDVATQCVAFDKTTGREIWRTGGSGGWNGAAPVVGHFDGLPCMVHGSGRCVVLADGRPLWHVPYGEMSVATPIVSGNHVFFSPFHGRNLGGQGCALVRAEGGKPQVVWNNDEVESLCLTSVLYDGHLYAPDRDDLKIAGESGRKMNVKCIDFQTGRVRWVERPFAMPTLIVAGDKLLIQTLTGELILAQASPDGYREYGRVDVLPGRCWTIPALADGKLYCRNNRGMIVCLDVRGDSPGLQIVDSPADPALRPPDGEPQRPDSIQRPAAPAEAARPEAADLHWPRFRGLCGGGLSSRADTPTHWDGRSGKGILWKAAVPLPGYSSPVVWDKHVLLTGADAKRSEVYCFDAASGTMAWRRGVPRRGETPPGPDPPWSASSYAAPTPVTDGRFVWAMFAGGDVACFDFEGKQRWTRSLGPLKNSYGHASSPVLYEDLLILQLDQASQKESGSKLLALESGTGRTVWEAKRPVGPSWSTPIVITAGGRDQLVACGNPWLISHDPDTGKPWWRADCLDGGYYVVPSPVYAGGMVLAATEGALLAAVRPDGSGDVGETHVVWTAEDDLPNVCTPVSNGELVFLLTSDGLLTCFELRSGRRIWQQDLSAADREFQASPVLVADRLYLLDNTGATHILKATRRPQWIGRAELGEPCPGASPALAAGRIYLRARDHLYCIGGTGQ